MTVLVSFETPQIQVNNSSTGVQLSQVILPYSIRNLEDSTQYLGGQMTLTPEDGIKLSDNTKQWTALALTKIKAMVADTEEYVAPAQVEDSKPTSVEDVVIQSEAEPNTETDINQ